MWSNKYIIFQYNIFRYEYSCRYICIITNYYIPTHFSICPYFNILTEFS